MKGMKNNKLKALAVALVLTMSAGMIPTTAGIEAPALTTTVEAAAKKITLKASSKKVYAGKTVKINAKATKGAKLSYKTSNKKIATVNSKGVITGKSEPAWRHSRCRPSGCRTAVPAPRRWPAAGSRPPHSGTQGPLQTLPPSCGRWSQCRGCRYS